MDPLPSSVHQVDLPDGRSLTLVGTAHVSRRSVEDVAAAIEVIEPDAVCVELDAARHKNLTDPETWRQLDVFQVLRQGRAPLLLSSLVMASFQRRIARELGVEPGAEMMEAIRLAEERGVPLHLVDRDIQVTLRRTWSRLGFFAKLKMLSQLVGSLFGAGEIDEEMVEQLKEEEKLNDLLDGLAQAFPQVKSTLIDERDVYLAQKIKEVPGERVLAVVGAGHVPGILTHLAIDNDLAPLEQVPPPSFWPRLLKWLIPLLIVGLLAYGFWRGGGEQSVESIALWVLINGALSALGAALAFGHPLTIASAFVAAPLTSLNPMVAAGWVAGLVQAWLRRPTVHDLERLPEAITTLRGFWGNPLCRILLVVVLANLGSTLGTVVAGSWIAARVF